MAAWGYCSNAISDENVACRLRRGPEGGGDRAGGAAAAAAGRVAAAAAADARVAGTVITIDWRIR